MQLLGRGDMWSSGFGSSYGGARGGGPMRGEGYGWRDAGPYGGCDLRPMKTNGFT